RKSLSASLLAELREAAWPGNVRELRNYLQRAFIMSEGTEVGPSSIPMQVSPARATPTATVSIPVGTSLADADRQLILATLEHSGGIKKRAAEILGISLKTLYNRLEEYAANGDDVVDSDARRLPEEQDA